MKQKIVGFVTVGFVNAIFHDDYYLSVSGNSAAQNQELCQNLFVLPFCTNFL